MAFSDKLKKARTERGISQEDLGKKAGVNPMLVSRYERGMGMPSAESLAKIARALDVATDYLVFDNVPMEEPREVNDVELFERFALADSLDERDRATLKNTIDAMVARKEFDEVVARRSRKRGPERASPQAPAAPGAAGPGMEGQAHETAPAGSDGGERTEGEKGPTRLHPAIGRRSGTVPSEGRRHPKRSLSIGAA